MASSPTDRRNASLFEAAGYRLDDIKPPSSPARTTGSDDRIGQLVIGSQLLRV